MCLQKDDSADIDDEVTVSRVVLNLSSSSSLIQPYIYYPTTTTFIRPLLDPGLFHIIAPAFEILGFPPSAAASCPLRVSNPTLTFYNLLILWMWKLVTMCVCAISLSLSFSYCVCLCFLLIPFKTVRQICMKYCMWIGIGIIHWLLERQRERERFG